MTPLDHLQLAIAQHLEARHSIKDVCFHVAPDDNDFWETYREETPELFPPRRPEMVVILKSFDTRRLQPYDTGKFRAMAKAHGYDYCGASSGHNDRLFFSEKYSPAELIGMDLCSIWDMERPNLKLPKMEPTDTWPDIMEGMKIFLRFVKHHDGILGEAEIDLAQDIFDRLFAKYRGKHQLDDELCELVYFTESMIPRKEKAAK